MQKIYSLIPALSAFLFTLFFSFSAPALTLVEVPGSALPGLLGRQVAAIRVLAKNGSGTLAPIPFQIDERRGPNGAWILDQEAAQAGAGTFDPFDVLLFVAEDAGEDFDAGEIPGAEFRYRVRAGGKAAAVLLLGSEAVHSEKSYLRYNPAQDRVSTSFYEAGFRPQQPLIQDILIPKNGAAQADLLDRFKVRFNLAIKNFFDFKVNEADVDARLVGTRVGPLRVIRRIVSSKKLGPFRLIPTATTDFYFYPHWMEIPTKVLNPVDGPKFLDPKTEGLSGYDFSAAAHGSTIRSSLGGGVWLLDGKPKDAVPTEGKALSWWSLSGPAGALIVGIQNDPKLSALGVHPIFKVIDDAERSAPPEGERGESFVGFDLPYAKIPKGTYSIHVKQVFPYRYQAGQEVQELQGAKTTPPKGVEAL